MKTVLLITGPGGDAQGWGDMGVTQEIAGAIEASGKKAVIASISSREDLDTVLDTQNFDIIWSALYHISDNAETVGANEGDDNWVADILDSRGLPYIGPNAATMKALIQKTDTHTIMDKAGVPVPYHFKVAKGDELPDLVYPAFVKPSCESRSVGISDNSVCNTPEELAHQIAYIQETFDQPALVEEYLPGQEYTVLLLGNGEFQEFLTGKVTVDPSLFGEYPILRTDLRGVGATKITPMTSMADQGIEITKKAMTALNCLDHVRADMRMDRNGKLKIIEVNGIPGLKPIKSWSPQIYTLHHPSDKGPMEDYRRLIDHIVSSALARYNLT